MTTRLCKIPAPITAAERIAAIILSILFFLSATLNLYEFSVLIESGFDVPPFVSYGMIWQFTMGVLLLMSMASRRRADMLARHKAAVAAGMPSPYVQAAPEPSSVRIGICYGLAGMMLPPIAAFVTASVAFIAGLVAFGHGRAKGWIAVGLALASAAAALSVINLYRPPGAITRHTIAVNGGSLGYTETVSEATARQVGDRLVEAGSFSGPNVNAEVTTTADGGYQVRLCVQQGTENEPEALRFAAQLADWLSATVFDGRPTEVHLCDGNMKTLKRLDAAARQPGTKPSVR